MRVWIFKILLLFPLGAISQNNSSEKLIREFLSVSRNYQQPSLYLKIEQHNSTNFIIGEEDTASVSAEFYLLNDVSYIRYGEMEQLVTDSLALIVSDQAKAMILYTNAGEVARRMRDLLRLPLPDSSIDKLTEKYQAVSSNPSKGLRVIELNNRTLVYGTAMPKETLSLEFDTNEKIPKQLIATNRMLIPLDTLEYNQLRQEGFSKEELLELKEGYYLIKKVVRSFMFIKVEKQTNRRSPVALTDRIERSGTDEYRPVKKYENYYLRRNDSIK
jgi:hypothetical protein